MNGATAIQMSLTLKIKYIMKTMKIKWLRFSFLLLGGILGMVLLVNAFQNHTTIKNAKVNQTWYYVGGASDLPTDSTKYSPNPHPTIACSDLIQEEICKIEAPIGSGTFPNLNAMATATKTARQQISDALANPSSPQTNETVKEFRPED